MKRLLLVITLAVFLLICCNQVTLDEGEGEGEGKIAFASFRDGNEDIYVMNADGSKQTRLTNNPALDAGPSWGP